MLTKDQLAKIFVSRQQYRLLLIRHGQNGLVRETGRHFYDSQNIMPINPQPLHHRLVDTLVRQENHESVWDIGYTTSARKASAANANAARTASRVRRG